MVDVALSVASAVGVLLSGGFVLYEVGRFATPQVAESRFDERREIIAYTVGLFVGIPLALVLLFYLGAAAAGAWLGAFVYLGLFLALREVSEWGLLQTWYFGDGPSGPFYALGFRSAIGGILILAVLAVALGGPVPAPARLVVIALESAALLALEAMGALVSVPRRYAGSGRDFSIVRAVVLGGLGYFLLAFGASSDPTVATFALLIVLAAAVYFYRSHRRVLTEAPPLSGATAPRARPGRYDRVGPAGPPGSR